MEVKCINNAASDNNTYIITQNQHALIIDPSCTDGRIQSTLSPFGVDIIFLTHGHYDHFTGLMPLHRKYADVPIYLNAADHGLAAGDPPLFGNHNQIRIDPLILTDLSEGTIHWQGMDIDIYHMPGHSPGSLVYHIGQYLFTGDVLFDDSIGRDDLPLGNGMDLRNSLKRFAMFDGSTIICPGHGPDSTMDQQWKTNPYLMHIHH